jgi:hypothetical protein
MGTNSNRKLKNNITYGGGYQRKVDADSQEVNRSFAQPNPNVPHEDPVEERATAEEQQEALTRHSKMNRDYGKLNEEYHGE